MILFGEYPLFQKGYRVKVAFNFISNTKKGHKVTLNGVEVGRVERVDFFPAMPAPAVVTLWIDSDYVLTDKCKFYISTMGYFGRQYINAVRGGELGTPLRNGDFIRGEDPIRFEELLKRGGRFTLQMQMSMENLKYMMAMNKNLLRSSIMSFKEGTEELRNDTLKFTEVFQEYVANYENMLTANSDNIINSIRGFRKNIEDGIMVMKKGIDIFDNYVNMVGENVEVSSSLIRYYFKNANSLITDYNSGINSVVVETCRNIENINDKTSGGFENSRETIKELRTVTDRMKEEFGKFKGTDIDSGIVIAEKEEIKAALAKTKADIYYYRDEIDSSMKIIAGSIRDLDSVIITTGEQMSTGIGEIVSSMGSLESAVGAVVDFVRLSKADKESDFYKVMVSETEAVNLKQRISAARVWVSEVKQKPWMLFKETAQ